MKKEIKLFVKLAFTSLSPDAQPISIGIVSDTAGEYNCWDNNCEYFSICDYQRCEQKTTKSFYAEFSDFSIDRCDDWVKENVISKLKFYNKQVGNDEFKQMNSETSIIAETPYVKADLKRWLSQFSDYDIQFVTDCGWFNWSWMVQLLDERETHSGVALIPESVIPANVTGADFIKELRKTHGNVILSESEDEIKWVKGYKTGLPKLPANISPVNEDLNDLIAIKKGISVREAFDLDREDLVFTTVDLKGHDVFKAESNGEFLTPITEGKYNALWDADVIKSIYSNIKS